MNPYARALASIIRLIAMACIVISALLITADYLGKNKKRGFQESSGSASQQESSLALKANNGSSSRFKKQLYLGLEIFGILIGAMLLFKGNSIAKKLTEDFDG